jgi:hypothetical protein
MSEMTITLHMARGTINNDGSWTPPDGDHNWAQGFENIFIQETDAATQIALAIYAHTPSYRRDELKMPNPFDPKSEDWPEWRERLRELISQSGLNQNLELVIPSSWTVPSEWGYYYTGMNWGGKIYDRPGNRPRRETHGGDGSIVVESNTANDFKMMADGPARIVDLWVADSDRLPNVYVVEQIGSSGNWDVKMLPHVDQSIRGDYMWVIATGEAGGPRVLCDPMIYNKGRGGT